MARFDKLEFHLEATDRRVDDLEVPIVPDPDPPYFSDEPEFLDIPWGFNHGPRGHGGYVRRRRVDFRDILRREGRLPDRVQGPAAYRSRPYSRQRSAWERPSGRVPQELERGFTGYRQPTSWDSPATRASHTVGRGETPRDLNMKAPRFDGSDASNWISRVDYYFNHLQMNDDDRLHYVVMLFQPPAAE